MALEASRLLLDLRPNPPYLEAAVDHRRASQFTPLALFLAIAVMHPETARAQLNVSFQGIHMDPADQDARDFSHASFGGGLRARISMFHLSPIIAAGAGIELVN